MNTPARCDGAALLMVLPNSASRHAIATRAQVSMASSTRGEPWLDLPLRQQLPTDQDRRPGAHRLRPEHRGRHAAWDRWLALPGPMVVGPRLLQCRTTSIVKASATDSRPAAFSKRSVKFSNAPEIEYRVRVDMYWYDAQGTQIGKATHAPDWYGWVATSHGGGIVGSDVCSPGV